MEGCSSPMKDENEEDMPWTYKEILELMCKAEAETKKKNFPKYWSSIQKYYTSFAPPNATLNLSPYDLHRKWRVASYKDKELSSIVMKVAPSIVSVSVFAGVKRYLDCSGFITDWDSSTQKATILTSAKVLRFPGKREDYYIAIRLANGKILLGEEDYVDHYNNIVTLKAESDATLKPVESISSPVETISEFVVALGREFYTCKLLESSGVIRTDHPYFGCEQLLSSTCSGSEVLEGGPLITRMGHGCGINFFDGSKFVHPLPTSVIDSCLNNQKTSCMRPWFGLSVIDIGQLPHDALENIAGVYGDSTAVVRTVYVGSPADKLKVYPGETVTALMKGQKKITINSASEYVRTMSNISEELSACPNMPPEILISVRGYDSDSCKVVHAENLGVKDKKFCYSWVVDESDEPEWDLEPRFGSQMAFTHDIDAMHENGINTDVILEPTWSETGTAYDNEMSDAVLH